MLVFVCSGKDSHSIELRELVKKVNAKWANRHTQIHKDGQEPPPVIDLIEREVRMSVVLCFDFFCFRVKVGMGGLELSV